LRKERSAMAHATAERPWLLRAEEGARLVNVSRSKFFAMMAAGEVPGVVRWGRSVRVNRVALERWVREQSGETSPDGGEGDGR
jgi:excisionase family DNA binding protein